MKALGAPADVLARAVPSEDVYLVWEENWEAVRFFLRMQTQWVIAGMGGYVGLNYQSVEFLFKLYEVEDPRDMLEKLQEIERGALEWIARENEEN